MLEAIGAGFMSVMAMQAMVFMTIGVVYGLMVGILPGLGGIVAMADMVRLKDGRYMTFFHDDGRWLRNS